MNFTIQLADKTIAISAHDKKLRDFFADYIVETDSADLQITWTKEDILAEQDTFEESYSLRYLETLAALRKISTEFPLHNRFLMHGASVAYDGQGYLFTAPSGTGKSTHIKLWRQYLGPDVKIINGDKPFISLADSKPRIYGSPWAGKENWHKNHNYPLKAICIVTRGTENKIRQVEPCDSLSVLMNQIYLPSNPLAAVATLDLIDKLLKLVPIYQLECDISENAVICSFEALTGKKYKKISGCD